MPGSVKNAIFHVISNTHWDREWRYPFQKNRQRLVEMMDSVLDILERESEYRAFHLDSQSVVISDYLEIRPDKAELIRTLVKQKRLFIGPWYILPDEFMVSGENLVRNLLYGHRTCREYGGASKVGYSPFSWGQISQLPQIYKEFGIDVVMFYRGVNSLDSEKAEFIWRGADGTEICASRFSTMPRYNFYFYIYRPVMFNEAPADLEFPLPDGGSIFRFAGKYDDRGDYRLIRRNTEYFRENIRPWVKKLIGEQIEDFTTPHVIWMEGHDSSGPSADTVRILRDIKEMMPELDVRHSTLEDYSEALKKDIDRDRVPVVEGERRSAQYDYRSGNLYGYITSARMYLKQMNTECEKWLERYAEPLNTIAGMLGMDISDRSLDIAWRMLLENSAHDSIGGCSLDTVHEDMASRYKQVKEIAQSIYEKACYYIISQLRTVDEEYELFLSVINTAQFVREEIIEIYADIPEDLDRGSLGIYTESGHKIPCDIHGVENVKPVLEQLQDRPMYVRIRRYRVHAALPSVHGLSVTRFIIRPQDPAADAKEIKDDIRPHLENAFLSVDVNQDGTLNIFCKKSGRTIRNTAYFTDEGEAGHAWVHECRGPVLCTRGKKAGIEVLRPDGFIRQLRISHRLNIPKDLQERDKDILSRSMEIETLVSLRENTDFLEFEILVNNHSEDHRLRMVFETDVHAELSWADGQFDMPQRPAERPDTRGWVEQPMYDYPMYHLAAIEGNGKGAAVFVDGLKEYEAGEDKHSLKITLFRAFHYTIAPSSQQDYGDEKGSQCPGRQHARIAFCPYEGKESRAAILKKAICFHTPLSAVQHGKTAGPLRSSVDLFTIENDKLILSCIKEPQDRKKGACILRLYNSAESDEETRIESIFPLKRVLRLSLEELPVGELAPLNRHAFRVSLGAKKIGTFRIEIDEPQGI